MHVVLVSWISAKVGVTKRGPAPAPVRARWGATRFEDLPVVEPPPALEIHWATVQHEPQENPRQHEPRNRSGNLWCCESRASLAVNRVEETTTVTAIESPAQDLVTISAMLTAKASRSGTAPLWP